MSINHPNSFHSKTAWFLGVLGIVIVAVSAVMRRVMTPNDWANIGMHRSVVLWAMSLGVVLFIAAVAIDRAKRKGP